MLKRTQKLIEALASRDERKVIGALKQIPHDGTVDVIRPMLSLLATEPSADVQLLLQNSLFNLKDAASLPVLIEALRDAEFADIQVEILESVWQSGLNGAEYLNAMVSIAVNNDYLVAIEAMTIIENSEGFSDEDLSNGIKLLDKALEKKTEKFELLSSLRQMLLDKLLDHEA